MNTAITVPFSDRFSFSGLAAELRALGAKFYVKPQGSSRIIEFSKLTEKANVFIESYRNQEIETVSENPINSVQQEVISSEPESTTVIEETISYFTAEELNSNYTKKGLEALAKDSEIVLTPSSKKKKANLVKFLAGKIQK